MMNRSILLFFFTLSVLVACKRRMDSAAGQTVHNEDFNWTITIPENFTSVSPDDWAKLQNKGAQAVEKTYGEKVENQATTIFVFRNGDYNYLESNYQPFDPEVDGDYRESFKSVNEIVYETFRSQIPTAKIDSASSVEEVSGLDFHTFNLVLDLPNGMKIRTLMYSRLFQDKDFGVNITYVDEEAGESMKKAWFASRFR